MRLDAESMHARCRCGRGCRLGWCHHTHCTPCVSTVTITLIPLPTRPVPRHCNREIISKVQQVICFAFHDSRLLLETCAEAKDSKKITTLFYLD